jgi:hypothetical protein
LEVVEMARALPVCGNALPVLCGAMRSLLTSQAMLLDRHTREEIVQWADDIYQGELSVSIKLENSKTTLGLVLFDDVVEIVLPGGPAFRAGLQKGDCILTVRTFQFCPRIFVLLFGPIFSSIQKAIIFGRWTERSPSGTTR